MIIELSEEYLPERILFRDKQVKQIEEVFQNYKKFGMGTNLVVFGTTGSGKCLKKGTKVFTEDGWEKIETLKNPKNILSLNIETLGYEWDLCYPIKLKHNDICKIITLKDGKKITCTPEHPLLVMDENGDLIWKKSKDIKKGDYLTVSELTKPHLNIKNISPSLSRMIGFLIGDGYLYKSKKNNCNEVLFSNIDKDLLKIFIDDVYIYFNKSIKSFFYDYGHRRDMGVKVCGLKIFNEFNKYIPSGKKSGIVALFSCDGTVGSGNIEYYTKSEKLARDVNLLLSNFGCMGKISTKKAKFNGKDYGVHWRVRISDGVSIMRFYERIGFYGEKQRKLILKYQKLKNQARWSRFIVPNIYDKLRVLKRPISTKKER